MAGVQIKDTYQLLSFYLFLLSHPTGRYHQLMGGHIHSPHQQCPEPNPLHADDTALQGNHHTGVGQLQTGAASAQRTPASPSLAHLARNVAPAGQQPWPRCRAPSGNDRRHSQAHPCGKFKRWT